MKKGLTELVFIIDRSGSMHGLEKDTVGGFNSMIAEQKNIEGEANITTVLFDDDYEIFHDRVSLKEIDEMTGSDYYVRGTTALLDAMGKTISMMGNIQKNLPKNKKAEKVLFVITTDGLENASREYSVHKVKSMIERQKNKYGWEFIFLGANIDAVKTAEDMGIGRDRSSNYCADGKGTKLNYDVVCKAVSSYRDCCIINEDWNESLEKDVEERLKK
ncbi:MAG TPA: vWA domain-containing protein [Anaerovoracaceae bacterium]|nr:vWA domain-containing protein [Anaerovoracaceae bacterium]